jgi:hypothetical protein
VLVVEDALEHDDGVADALQENLGVGLLVAHGGRVRDLQGFEGRFERIPVVAGGLLLIPRHLGRWPGQWPADHEPSSVLAMLSMTGKGAILYPHRTHERVSKVVTNGHL